MSLALESSSAERPSTSRRLTSLPSVAPTMAPLRGDHQHDFRLGIVPGRDRVQARLHAVADRRHRLRLGEDLRVRADADLQVLRPGALLDQHALELGGLRAAGHELGEIAAELGRHAVADRLGLLRRSRAPAPRSRAPAWSSGKVTPAALMACRSMGASSQGLRGSRVASGVLARMSASAPMRSPLPPAHECARDRRPRTNRAWSARAARCRRRHRRAPRRRRDPLPSGSQTRPARAPVGAVARQGGGNGHVVGKARHRCFLPWLRKLKGETIFPGRPEAPARGPRTQADGSSCGPQ